MNLLRRRLLAEERVALRTAYQAVGTGGARKDVVARSADEGIVAAGAGEGVGGAEAPEPVVACAAGEEVVAGTASKLCRLQSPRSLPVRGMRWGRDSERSAPLRNDLLSSGAAACIRAHLRQHDALPGGGPVAGDTGPSRHLRPNAARRPRWRTPGTGTQGAQTDGTRS